MALEEKQKRLSFYYRIVASLVIVVVMFGLATYVFLRAQAGIVAWQPYPIFAVFTAAVFFGDWFVSCRGCGPE